MKKYSEPLKMVLLVGTEVDELIVTTVAKPLLPPGVSLRTVTMGIDLAGFHAAYGVIIDLLPHHYQHFLILFDAKDRDEADEIQELIIRPIRDYGLLQYVTFCPIVPNINAWLLGKYQLPEKRFGQEFDLSKIAKVAKSLDVAVLKRENASFKWFAERLQQLTQVRPAVLKRAA